jgi:hypothetical protein
MPRYLKTRLSTIADPHLRGVIKKSLIGAILYAQDQERALANKKASRNDG